MSYQIGDKVIPLRRNPTPDDIRNHRSPRTINQEPNWLDSRQRRNFFLWVVREDEVDGVVWCLDRKVDSTRDGLGFDYLLTDVVPWSEHEEFWQKQKYEAEGGTYE
jgi:hypothetical protein